MTTVPGATEKTELYRALSNQLREVLRDLVDPVAAMASVAAIVHQGLPYASWTGFYRVVAPELLRIGPYQGPLGCLEIPFGRGVCGAAASRREAVIVDDVDRFPGHITCDPRSRSEIVIPVYGSDDELTAVLDIDSHLPAAFDDLDRQGLEAISALLGPCFAGP